MYLRVPELAIGARETETFIGSGFLPRDLGINMSTRFYGVSLKQTVLRLFVSGALLGAAFEHSK